MKTLTLTVAILALTAALAGAETLRVGTEGAYPPFNFLNDKNEVDGFERELGDELCKRAGLTCEWRTNDWDSLIPGLAGGRFDVIMAGMTITAEREKLIDFTQNYLPPAESVYVARNADADLVQGPIAVQSGTIQEGYVEASGAKLVQFATADETVAAVRNGDAVAVLSDHDYIAPIVQESNGELTIVGDPVAIGDGIGIGMRKADGALKEKLSTAIQSVKDDGSLNAMIRKWFGDTAKTF